MLEGRYCDIMLYTQWAKSHKNSLKEGVFVNSPLKIHCQKYTPTDWAKFSLVLTLLGGATIKFGCQTSSSMAFFWVDPEIASGDRVIQSRSNKVPLILNPVEHLKRKTKENIFK